MPAGRDRKGRSCNRCIGAYAWVRMCCMWTSAVTCGTREMLRTERPERAGEGPPPARDALARAPGAVTKTLLPWNRSQTGKLQELESSGCGGRHHKAIIRRKSLKILPPNVRRAERETQYSCHESPCAGLGRSPQTSATFYSYCVNSSVHSLIQFPQSYEPTSAQPCIVSIVKMSGLRLREIN